MLVWRLIRRALANAIVLALTFRVVTVGLAAMLLVSALTPALLFPAEETIDSLAPGVGPAPSQLPRGADGRAPASPIAPAVAQYLEGIRAFDATLMWDAMSAEARAQVQSKGGSLEKLQAGMDEAARRGAKIEDISYIGAYPLRDGRTYYFFVISRSGFAAEPGIEQIYFVFTVGRSGKITMIE